MSNSIDHLFDRGRFDFVDLTHPMRPAMSVWPTHPHFCQEVIESHDRGDVAANRSLRVRFEIHG
jgi:arylformamidase